MRSGTNKTNDKQIKQKIYNDNELKNNTKKIFTHKREAHTQSQLPVKNVTIKLREKNT